ncbi:hypothetical protein [Phenylobacterium sp.]|uniref:hypothetical protein n=1 Tax=Phenylobacterium sp. TaxID=1871053 RepID=UPI0025EFC060|nr:hypothetical protein [Phenylobacterium sp.]
MRALVAALARPGDEARVLDYAFWAGDFVNPDLDGEARLAAGWRPDVVVAKSIGCLVAAAACADHGLAPRACVLIGAPVNRLLAEARGDLLARHAARAPTLFIQQAEDPTGSLAELARLVPGQAVREASGADHLYADIPELVGLIEAWPGWPSD